MSDIENLSSKVDSLIDDFLSTDAYKRYRILKDELDNDEYLSSLLKKREELQSSIKYLKDEKKDEAISICKKIQIEYENSPLYINFITAKEELLELIKPLTEAKL